MSQLLSHALVFLVTLVIMLVKGPFTTIVSIQKIFITLKVLETGYQELIIGTKFLLLNILHCLL